jgi:hypothetical protein
MAVSSIHNGWRYDPANSRLDFYYRGTRMGHVSATDLTAANGFTVTSGGATITAGDAAITAGNVRLGAIETFATTEPTSAVVMKSGTAPAGAITTSNGIFSSDTVVRKIIAAGTVSNVET